MCSHSCSCTACYFHNGCLCACARFLLLTRHWFCTYNVSCVVTVSPLVPSILISQRCIHFSCQLLQCSAEDRPITIRHPQRMPVVQYIEDVQAYSSLAMNSLILWRCITNCSHHWYRWCGRGSCYGVELNRYFLEHLRSKDNHWNLSLLRKCSRKYLFIPDITISTCLVIVYTQASRHASPSTTPDLLCFAFTLIYFILQYSKHTIQSHIQQVTEWTQSRPGFHYSGPLC